MPFGPYILCALAEMRSASAATSSRGSLAAPCAASTWSSAPCWRITGPSAEMSVTVPVCFHSIRDTDDRLDASLAEGFGVITPRHRLDRSRSPTLRSSLAESRTALCPGRCMICTPETRGQAHPSSEIDASSRRRSDHLLGASSQRQRRISRRGVLHGMAAVGNPWRGGAGLPKRTSTVRKPFHHACNADRRVVAA